MMMLDCEWTVLVKKERKNYKLQALSLSFFLFSVSEKEKNAGIAEVVFACDCKDGDGMHSGILWRDKERRDGLVVHT